MDNPVLQAVNLDFGAFRSSLYVDDLERVMPATLVEIHRNAALQSVSVPARPLGDEAALDDGLTSADFFLLSDNPSLRHIDFGGLHRVGLLSIANHPSLDMVTLGALARVEDLEVRDNPLLSDPPSTAWRPSSAR